MIATMINRAVALLVFGGCLVPDAFSAGNESIDTLTFMDVPGGHVHTLLDPWPDDRSPIKVNVVLAKGQPAGGWVPNLHICARGASKSEYSCVAFIVQDDGRSIQASVFAAPKSSNEGKRLRHPIFSVGREVALEIRLQQNHFALLANGTELVSADTEFEVTGHAFGCTSAICQFTYPK